MAKWINTEYPGVRYRQHPSRKYGVQFDKYFSIRYTLNGKRMEEGVGWASEKWAVTNMQTGKTTVENWTAEKVSHLLNELKKNQKTGTGPQTLAEKRAIKKEEKDAEAEQRERIKRESVTFSEFWDDHYLPNAKMHKGKRTVETEEAYYKNWIKPVIGRKPLNAVVYFDLERIQKKLKEAGRSPKTIKDNYAIVRQVINRANSLGMYTGKNPFDGMKREQKPKTADNKRTRYLTKDEAETLLSAIYKKSPDLYDICIIALDCAPRAKEIFGLEWTDINFENKLVTFRDTKNENVRHIPMTDRVLKMLNSRKAATKSRYVFPARGGKKSKVDKKRTEVSNLFTQTVNDLGLNKGIEDRRQKIVFHSLRHTCASWLVIAGVPLYTVKEFLGHKQISQTERYSHLAPESLQDAVRVLNGNREKTPEEKLSDIIRSLTESGISADDIASQLKELQEPKQDQDNREPAKIERVK